LCLLFSIALSAAAISKKAVVTMQDGSIREVLIADESLDSLKLDLLGTIIPLSKSNIKTIAYPDNQSATNYPSLNLTNLINQEYNRQADLNRFPLQHKKYGVETSVIGLLTIFQPTGYLTADFSCFNLDRTAEIVLPISCSWDNKGGGKHDYSIISGLQYRKFLGLFNEIQTGFYVSGLYTLAKVQASYNDSTFSSQNNLIITEKKYAGVLTGFGFGCGYRYFSPKGWYWGTQLSISRYLGKHDKIVYSSPFGTAFGGDVMFDFELLKFGWTF